MLKRLFSIMLAVVVISGMFTGCGSSSAKNNQTTKNDSAEKVVILIVLQMLLRRRYKIIQTMRIF